MNQTIEMPRTLLDLLAHIIIDLHVKDIGHEIQRILIVLHFRIEARKIEPICQIILVDLAEVLVAPGRDELRHKISACCNDNLRSVGG